MANENQAQAAVAADSKKRITIIVVVVIVAIIIWQVISMMGGGSAPAPHPATPTKMAAAGAPGPAGSAPAGGGTAVPQPQQQDQTPRNVPVVANQEILTMQKDSEVKYIKALNDLQMLKVQKDIAEANQAIAKSKLETVTAEKSIAEFLTPKIAPVTEGAYSNMLGAPGGGKPGGPGGAGLPTSLAEAKAQLGGLLGAAGGGGAAGGVAYVVLSVSQQDNKWSAVLGNQGKLYSVSTGDILNADGSVVQTISREGVILEKNGAKRKVPISSEI